jgi:hypothetical protein
MPVRDFLKSLSATYRNCCPGLSETRSFFVRHAITRKKRMARPVCKGDFEVL